MCVLSLSCPVAEDGAKKGAKEFGGTECIKERMRGTMDDWP